MKLIFRLAFLFAWLFSTAFTLRAQCNNYPCVIENVKTLMQQKIKKYQIILDNLDAAEGYPDSKHEEIRALRRRVFTAIENERKEAEKLKEEAQRQTKIAISEKERADKALFKAQEVLDHIYFYQDKFGLAYNKKEDKYGFIDKSLNTLIDYKYEEALPFSNIGFAKMKRADLYFWLDTKGEEFRLASNVDELDSATIAIDLKKRSLKTISPFIFDNTQIKILQLSNNQLKILPPEIGKLTNLQNLYLGDNRIEKLLAEIRNLKSLQILDLRENPISDEEIQHIQSALPNCKVLKDKEIQKVKPDASDQNSSVKFEKGEVLGIDISHYDETSQTALWPEVKKKYKFIYIRCTQGANIKDPAFPSNVTKAKNAGLYYGAYHFPDLLKDNVDLEVDFFLNYSHTAGISFDDKKVLPPVCDVEATHGREQEFSANKTIIVERLKKWLEAVEKITGRVPVIYTNRSVWDKLLGSPKGFENYLLWVGNFSPGPKPPLPATWNDYAIWQFTESGKVGEGMFDLNKFNGGEAEFQKFMQNSRVKK